MNASPELCACSDIYTKTSIHTNNWPVLEHVLAALLHVVQGQIITTGSSESSECWPVMESAMATSLDYSRLLWMGLHISGYHHYHHGIWQRCDRMFPVKYYFEKRYLGTYVFSPF